MTRTDASRTAMAPMRLGDVGAEPLVSVLITNFNYGRFVGEAIESVLAQGYERFEVIVCDDGSSDDSCEVVEGYVARAPSGTRLVHVRFRWRDPKLAAEVANAHARACPTF